MKEIGIQPKNFVSSNLSHSPTLNNFSKFHKGKVVLFDTQQEQSVETQPDPEAFLPRAVEHRSFKQRNGIIIRKEFIDTLAATAGALIATTIVYPLDNIRVRISLAKTDISAIDIVKKVVKKEGIYGFYRGLHSAIIGVGLSWGIYHGAYNILKCGARDKRLAKLGSIYLFLANLASVLFSILLSNPVWIINTRRTIESPATSTYGLCARIFEIYKKEGLKGLLSGFTPSLFLSLTPAIQFILLHHFKSLYLTWKKVKVAANSHGDLDSIEQNGNKFHRQRINHPKYSNIKNKIEISPLEYMILGLIAKLLVNFIFYPYRLIKARLQSRSAQFYSNGDQWRYIFHVLEKEGIKGYFRGVTAKLVADGLSTAIMLLIYRHLLRFFNRVFDKNWRPEIMRFVSSFVTCLHFK